MNKLVLVAFLAVVGLACARPQEKYTTKYDNVDIDSILSNERLLNNYVNCLLEKGKCTKDGEELKRVLPDALNTECKKCSEKQRNGARKVLHHLIEKKPDTWKLLEAKYDPAGKYRKQYDAEIKKEGLKV